MQEQVYIFGIFILNGLIIGLLFDIFRIFRKSFKTPDTVTYIHDILFWILTGLTILFSIFKFNNGELRSYIFLGIAFGVSIYLLAFSKLFIEVSVNLINILKKIMKVVIIRPVIFILKLLRKIIFKPISFIFINLGKIKVVFIKNISKMRKIHLFRLNNKKKVEEKKDFT